MQSMEVISVNIWLILISLCNLLLLFLILKKFLFKPVKKIMNERQAELDKKYYEANEATRRASADKNEWSRKLSDIQNQAHDILEKASANANEHSDKIISEAKDKASEIIHQAELDAKYEKKKAEDSIKQEIVDISASIAETILKRAISADDHKNLINSFINEIGDIDG